MRPLNPHLESIRELAAQGVNRTEIASKFGMKPKYVSYLSYVHQFPIIDERTGRIKSKKHRKEFVSPCKVEAAKCGHCYMRCHEARNGYCEFYKGAKLL